MDSRTSLWWLLSVPNSLEDGDSDGWDSDASSGVTPAVTKTCSSQPAGSPRVKCSEHTVKCVLPMSKVTAQGKGARRVMGSCWISHRGGSPHCSLPGLGCGLPCCNSAREMVGWSSQRGRPVCRGHPAWEKPLYPPLNLIMMLQILESRDSPQYSHYPLQPREGRLPSTAQEWPGIWEKCFFPKNVGCFFPLLFSESQL